MLLILDILKVSMFNIRDERGFLLTFEFFFLTDLYIGIALELAGPDSSSRSRSLSLRAHVDFVVCSVNKLLNMDRFLAVCSVNESLLLLLFCH